MSLLVLLHTSLCARPVPIVARNRLRSWGIAVMNKTIWLNVNTSSAKLKANARRFVLIDFVASSEAFWDRSCQHIWHRVGNAFISSARLSKMNTVPLQCWTIGLNFEWALAILPHVFSGFQEVCHPKGNARVKFFIVMGDRALGKRSSGDSK